MVFAGGSGISVGESINPYSHNKVNGNASNELIDFTTMSRQEIQDLLLQKLTNAFMYRFVIVNDRVPTNRQALDVSQLDCFHRVSMNGGAIKRKFDEIDGTSDNIKLLLNDENDIAVKRRRTDEDFQKQIEDLQQQLQGAMKTLSAEREAMQKQINQFQSMLNEERIDFQKRLKEAEERIEILKQQPTTSSSRNAFPIEDIEQEFTCAICQELIVNATTLQCSHTFCKPCLAEWIKQKKICPICRKRLTKPPTRNLTMENILDKLVKNLTKEEQDNRERRKKEIIEAEERASQKLKELVENARSKGVKFLNLQDRWSEEEKRVFKTGVSRHEGRARLMYCELTGFNADWIKKASTQMIVRACDNLEIEIPKTKVENTTHQKAAFMMDYELAREKLLDFLEGDNVLLLN